jgi:hypothetical protein
MVIVQVIVAALQPGLDGVRFRLNAVDLPVWTDVMVMAIDWVAGERYFGWRKLWRWRRLGIWMSSFAVPVIAFAGVGAAGAVPDPKAGETPLAPPHEARKAIQATERTHFKYRNAVGLLFLKRTQPPRISMQPSDFPFLGQSGLSLNLIFAIRPRPSARGDPRNEEKSTDQPTTSPEQHCADEP